MKELEKIERKGHFIKVSVRDEKHEGALVEVEREIRFNFSAWAELEKKYGSINNLQAMQDDLQERPFQTLPEIVYIALTDKSGIDKNHLSECLSGYDFSNFQSLIDEVSNALNESLPQDNKKKAKAEKR